MAASPAIALAGLVLVVARGARARSPRRRPCSRCGRSRRSSRTGSPSRCAERDLALGPEDRALPPRRGPHDVEVLRGVHGPGGPLPARGQLPGGARRRIAHRTSPTNIGMGLLSTLAAHDLGFIPTGELVERIDATLTTMEGLERHRGAPLQLVRHGEPRAAPAPLRLDRGQRQPRRRAHRARPRGSGGSGASRAPAESGPSDPCERLESLSRRAAAFADGMSFRFLYDPQRSLLSIGYRAADAEGPGRLDPSHYDLLASEARLASFIAIAKGDLPEKHWFHLGPRGRRACTGTRRSCRGARRCSSTSCRCSSCAATRTRCSTRLPDGRAPPAGLRGRARGAVGDLGVRLRPRRSPRQLPVQGVRRPGARHEAGPRRRARGRALRDRARRARPPHRGGGEPPPPRARRASLGAYGYFDAIDYTPRRPEEPEAAAPGARPHPGHDRPDATSPTTRG